MKARALTQRRAGEPVACCDFASPQIDAVGGRYYFSIVLDLIEAGYFPVFTLHRGTVSSFGPGRMKSLLLNQRLGTVGNVADLQEPFLLITDSEAEPGLASQVVRVDYERRLPRRADELALAVFVHPQIAIKGQLPFAYDAEARRPARIFFGGNTSEGKYDRAEIGEIYAMLTRREMLEVVLAHVPSGQTHRPANAADWLASPEPRAFVLCETQICRIPPERWLEALSKGDFFLACPGVGMPLCHNLVEAMAAGSIPILQYGRYLTPALEDGVNCLAFTDARSLAAVTSRVLAMDAQEITALRHGVRRYYDEHQAPGRFAGKLAALRGESPTLLINSYRLPR